MGRCVDEFWKECSWAFGDHYWYKARNLTVSRAFRSLAQVLLAPPPEDGRIQKRTKFGLLDESKRAAG